MKAVCWFGRQDVRVEEVPAPKILHPRDAIIRITLTAICGSDLHLYDGYIPTMQKGDIMGHEFMGEVVEVGPGNHVLKSGDRVVVPFPISCGNCFYCKKGLWSLCDNSNPNAAMAEAMYGFSGAGLYGYSHLYGGYAGGQAQYGRVPFADVGPLKIPKGLPDEKVLFLSYLLPTGYMAAENCNIQPGDVVAVWGCGPVGLFAVKSAYLLGAERVIAIDRFPERLRKAEEMGCADLINCEQTEDLIEELKLRTGGRGPDACIDAVGTEVNGPGAMSFLERVEQVTRMEIDRPMVLRQAIHACRKGGTVSIPGVYGGFIDNIPMGVAFAKGLNFRIGQTHVHRYLRPLLERIVAGEIDPSAIITHEFPLDEAPRAYKIFREKQESCLKVVLKP